ncbi:MAG: CbiX/SirB N-terminal domain-containing protein [Hyphomicrobium sp.]
MNYSSMNEYLRDCALVLAAHGDRGGAAPNTKLLGHRDTLEKIGDFRSVTAGVLKGEPSLEEAVLSARATGASKILVYPMFMADGYFTKTVLPQRLEALGTLQNVQILPPLGINPRLPAFILEHALSTAHHHQVNPKTSRLLVVGHGSQLGPASSESTQVISNFIAQQDIFATVETAFLEEAEFLEDALKRTSSLTLVVGFFSGDGLHASDDVPQMISSAGARAIYAGSIGALPKLATFIVTEIKAHFSSHTFK